MNDDIPGIIAYDTSSAGSGNVEYCQTLVSLSVDGGTSTGKSQGRQLV